MIYALKLIASSAASLAAAYVLIVNLELVVGLGDLVLFVYLAIATVVGPGLVDRALMGARRARMARGRTGLAYVVPTASSLGGNASSSGERLG